MAEPEPVAWVLNLDAEEELARPGAHTPSASAVGRIGGLRGRLGALLGPDDVVVWPDETGRAGASEVRPRAGRAWCPTRFALAALARAGAPAPAAPPQAVLRRVNHRRFAHALGAALPGAAWAESPEALAALLSRRTLLEEASGEACWLVRRPFGFAGRGRRKVRASGPDPAERAWLAATFRAGEGLLVEPWVDRVLDCALHGWMDAAGACTFGQLTLQEVDSHGAWVESRIAPPGTLEPAEQRALEAEARRAAAALHAAGYFGAFGLDAFRWRPPRGGARFQPRSEVNARYSMGWALGMGGFRPPAGAP